MSPKTSGASSNTRSNFPRSVPLAERVLALEHGQTMLAKSVSEITSNVTATNQRMDAVDDWQTKMLVSEATRIEQQKATDLVIVGLSKQLERWNNNFGRAVWIVLTPILAGIPVAVGVIYLIVQGRT